MTGVQTCALPICFPVTIGAVNRGIGSSDNSQHCKGEAVDFVTHQYTPRQIVEMIKKSDIPYDQLILEYESWVHISFSSRNRKQFFVIS